jgi:hypothetical protein
MAAGSTLARTAKIGNDKIGFSSALLRSGRFDKFRNNLITGPRSKCQPRASVSCIEELSKKILTTRRSKIRLRLRRQRPISTISAVCSLPDGCGRRMRGDRKFGDHPTPYLRMQEKYCRMAATCPQSVLPMRE